MALTPAMPLPFTLPPHQRVLVTGCGGGFDVVCALPIALALRAAGHQVHLASYSFTDLAQCGRTEQPFPHLYKVDARSHPPPPRFGDCIYFPEGYLAQWWLARHGEELPVWSFGLVGPAPLREAYTWLADHLRLDCIIVCDGGVDGLFIGNEHDLGSPAADAASILAVSGVPACEKIFAFTAFGTEGTAHEVRHADALLRISELVQQQAMLGVSAAAPGSAPAEGFRDAVRYIFSRTDPILHSNMGSSIVAAMEGKFGETPVTLRTQVDRIWVSPLTLLYWFFDLDAVAHAKPYAHEVREAGRLGEVHSAIERTRERMGVLPRADIPI